MKRRRSIMKTLVFLIVGSCALIVGVCSDVEITTTEDSSPFNSTEEEKKFIQDWTRLFFSMSKIPRQGKQTLVFPGLFNEVTSSSREMRNHSYNESALLHYYMVAENGNETNIVALPLTDEIEAPHVMMTSDSRLYGWKAEIDHYMFENVEAMDDDLRSKRRLRSARNETNLLQANEEHVSMLINTVLSSGRDILANESARASVVRFLTQKMRSFGLVTGNQIFEPNEFSELFEGRLLNGTNIVGILPGELWGTKDDEVLVIGAHWDTVPTSKGMDDNGSGVTAVLEVARAMTEASCRPRHTIIFVLFDLEEVGCLGSLFFIRDFLIPQILLAHNGAKLKGAFILDTIMNYNQTENSQTLPPEWQKALPEFWTDLESENKIGDFLAVLYRKDVDAPLANAISKYWKDPNSLNHNKQSTPRPHLKPKQKDASVETVTANSPFRLKTVRMDLDAEVGDQLEKLGDWIDLLRSDHSRFWYHSVEGYENSLPAVLITDTAPYRGVMQECYHQDCDSSSANQNLKFANVKFLTKTCDALIKSMASLSDAHCLFQQPFKSEHATTSSSFHIQSNDFITLFGTLFVISITMLV